MIDPLSGARAGVRGAAHAGRRAFLGQSSMGLGALALRSILGDGEPTRAPHFAPRARRVVYLFQAGGPSPFETFDRIRDSHLVNG